MYDEYQNEKDGMQQEAPEENQPLPLYGEVDGQQIYMGGLDYSLLQKHQHQQAKLGLLSNIKNQLFAMQSKIDSRTVKSTPEKPLDHQSITLITAIKNLQNTKPLVNNSTFYLFDTNYHFGKLQPQIITKRFGRMNKEAAYIKLTSETIAKFKTVLQKPQFDREKLAKDKAFDKLMNSRSDQSSSESSDNIFGSDDDQHESSKKKQTKLFNFGQKLNFGIKDQEIFNEKPAVNQPEDFDKFQAEQEPSQEKDKYEFLRKKVKKTINPNEEQEDGYGECYYQSGPSFQQMKEYKNAGIELFGDLKEAPKKQERKTNIHRQYDMVKRIIDQKSKKK